MQDCRSAYPECLEWKVVRIFISLQNRNTLQKVREVGGDKFSYASDYEIVTKLKAFSDKHGLCLLVVHHTRKMESSDSFDMISGTNGLLGAADGAFVMQKEKRTDNKAILEIADPVLDAIAGILTEEQTQWKGTASELLQQLPQLRLAPNILTRKLNIGSECLLCEYGIRYESVREHNGRMILLSKSTS